MNKKKRESTGWKLLLALLFVTALVIIWFIQPYSPTKEKFHQTVQSMRKDQDAVEGRYTEKDFEGYPLAIRNYIQQSGFIGKEKESYLHFYFADVEFYQSPDRKLTIDYSQYNFSSPLARIAHIKSGLFGIPFEGLDILHASQASMKGVLGKCIPLFNQSGDTLLEGNLVTYLAESLFTPRAILENNISFQEVNKHEVHAILKHEGYTVSGTFFFNEHYEMIEFYTTDRSNMDEHGNVESIPWTAKSTDYERNSDGISLPRFLQAIWNYPDRDFVYFSGRLKDSNFGYEK